MDSTEDANSGARTKTMNITLPLHLHEAVRERVASGSYTSASEVLCCALRLLLSLSERPADLAERPDMAGLRWREVRNALLHGESSLAAERAGDLDELYLTALELKRIQVRQELPNASEDMIRRRLAAWLRERVGEEAGRGVDGDWERPVSPERFARIRQDG